MIYAGIGSRETPEEILKLFIGIGKVFAERDCVLRSGGADGADSAFEKGCVLVNGQKEIYLPWKGFNGNKSAFIVQPGEAFEITEKYHPCFSKLTDGAKKLQARNSHQVLGLDLKSPADCIICYTSKTGGTTQALRIAEDYQIPIFNAYEYANLNDFRRDIWNFYQQSLLKEAGREY